MVIFHMLNGDSDGAAATRDFTKLMTGSNYTDLMEVFYGGNCADDIATDDGASAC